MVALIFPGLCRARGIGGIIAAAASMGKEAFYKGTFCRTSGHLGSPNTDVDGAELIVELGRRGAGVPRDQQ